MTHWLSEAGSSVKTEKGKIVKCDCDICKKVGRKETMKANDLIIGIIGILVVFIIGFGVGAYGLPHKEIVEKNITVEVPVITEKLVTLNTTCPECITERTIEKIIEKPCPECRCLCKVSGAWEDNRTWWYKDNATLGYTN